MRRSCRSVSLAQFSKDCDWNESDEGVAALFARISTVLSCGWPGSVLRNREARLYSPLTARFPPSVRGQEKNSFGDPQNCLPSQSFPQSTSRRPPDAGDSFLTDAVQSSVMA